jgi:predicted permease
VLARVRSLVDVLFRRSRFEGAMAEEIRFHMEAYADDLVRGGMSPAEATRRARVEFGSVEAVREDCRQARGLRVVDELRQDLRYAHQQFVKTPGFTAAALLTLALGIGASTAMFSVLHGVLLRDLPVRDEDELVSVWLQPPAGGNDRLPLSHRALTAAREESRVFQSVGGVNFQGAVDLVMLDAGNPVTVAASWVTGDFFSVLGVDPVLGRTLRPSDDVPGAAPATVISYAFWQRYFGGDSVALGRVLAWNDKSYTVVGVLPRGFEYPKRTQAWFAVIPWFPATLDPTPGPNAMFFELIGRLRPGTSAQTARAQLAAFQRASDPQRPISGRGSRPIVTPFPELITGGVTAILWTASAAVGLLLLIACVNVANLLLIRGSARTQELAIRSALGAGRRRLVRQLLVETVVLCLVAGVLGVLLAVAAVPVLIALAPAELPQREMIGIDPRVLVFAVGVTAATTLLSGLLPAVVSVTGDLSGWLRGGRGAVAGARSTRALRHGLVIGQVSLAILVAVGAGLLARSLRALETVDMGFNADRLLVVETMLPPSAAPNRAGEVALQERMLARVAAIPGVISATVMPKPPFSGQGGWIATYTGDRQTPAAQATNPPVNFEVVGPGYFHNLGIPILQGRAFDQQDREGAPRVAIISQAVARHTWPGENPIGRRVKIGGFDEQEEWLTVVGVVGETRYRDLTTPQPSLYLPTGQFDGPVPMTLAVRTRTDPAGMLPQVRAALREVHPGLLPTAGGPMRQLLAAPLARPRFSALLVGSFATITVLLALVGIYGALAAAVSQRRREIAIRFALGATVGEVRTLVLGQGVRLALMGSALGVLVALSASRLLQSMLFGITATDPVTFLGVVVLVVASAALASYLPARRVTHVEPMTTLRTE